MVSTEGLLGHSLRGLAVALCACLTLKAEEGFDWSWDKGGGAPSTNAVQSAGGAATSPSGSPAEAGTNAGFDWSWDQAGGKGEPRPAPVMRTDPAPVPPAVIPEKKPAAAAPVQEVPPAVPEPVVAVEAERVIEPAPAPKPEANQGAVAVDAYNELVKENLELRRRFDEASRKTSVEQQEKARLQREIGELEKSLRESVTAIKNIEQKAGAVSGGTAEAAELRDRLAREEAEKARLKSEADALKKKLAELQAGPAAVSSAPQQSAIAPGSDLFAEIEGENKALRDKIAAMEAGQQKALNDQKEVLKQGQKAISEADKMEREKKKLEAQLEQARDKDAQNRKTLEKLVQELPKLQAELVELRKKNAEKEAKIGSNETEKEILKAELQKREDRLTRVERTAAILEQARREIAQVRDVQQRDMLYNMAVVYVKEGKFKDAEQAYLKALQLDSTDADIHYNLAILYEEDLGDEDRAAVHYRRYLKLKPNAPDADVVRSWLIQMEAGR